MNLIRHIRCIAMEESLTLMKNIFMQSVESVQPVNLIQHNFLYDKEKDLLQIFTKEHFLNNRDVYVVGAGKAVLQMALEVEKILGCRMKKGIVSVPYGITEKIPISNTVLEIYEGGRNNYPDENSYNATLKILNLLQGLNEKSFILVLLSGGGSALLCSPLPPLTMENKVSLNEKLVHAGANIVDLNIVRKKLSAVKGGKLAHCAHPAEVVSLLIVDIVGIHAQYVASGPTYENHDAPNEAAKVVEKYSLQNDLLPVVRNVLYSKDILSQTPFKSAVNNYVLGNNTIAIDAAYITAFNAGYLTVNLTNSIHGDVEIISHEYCCLVTTLIRLMSKNISLDTARAHLMTLTNICSIEMVIDDLLSVGKKDITKGICLVAGGEPTVKITGEGIGGRSQHLSLNFSIQYNLELLKDATLNDYNVYMLCAGTDGIDGPTDAAGAFGYSQLVKDAEEQHLDPNSYLTNNDSYSFYNRFLDGKFLIKTGHTNTNVMDIHVVVIEKKS